MRRVSWVCAGFLICLAGRSFAKAPAEVEAGKRMEMSSCAPCHSLRLIESQRLSEAAWKKEVGKMIGWGAVVPDREVLVDYLFQHYGNMQAPPVAERSADSK